MGMQIRINGRHYVEGKIKTINGLNNIDPNEIVWIITHIGTYYGYEVAELLRDQFTDGWSIGDSWEFDSDVAENFIEIVRHRNITDNQEDQEEILRIANDLEKDIQNGTEYFGIDLWYEEAQQ